MSEAHAIPRWTVGDRMRKARLVADLSADEMAEEIGRTRRTISNYEAGATRPPFLVLRQYALRCGVPFDWLAHGTGEDSVITPPATVEYSHRSAA